MIKFKKTVIYLFIFLLLFVFLTGCEIKVNINNDNEGGIEESNNQKINDRNDERIDEKINDETNPSDSVVIRPDGKITDSYDDESLNNELSKLGVKHLNKKYLNITSNYNIYNTDEYTNYKDKVLDFCNRISAKVLLDNYNGNNITFSPISVFLCVATSTSIIKDEIALNEVLNGLGITLEELEYVKYMIDRLCASGDTQILDVVNTLWINDEDLFYEDTLATLGKKFYCNALYAPFRTENIKANQAVREFVKEKTRGLIDQNFNLNNKTECVLMNILYVKDCWKNNGKLSGQPETFTCDNGETIEEEFLTGDYQIGKIGRRDNYSFANISTINGRKLVFVLPNDGINITQLLNKETFDDVTKNKYRDTSEGLSTAIYKTKCIFPKFTSDGDVDLATVMEEEFNIRKIFNAFNSDTKELYVSKMKQKARLVVDEFGFEGAAVTYMAYGATSVGPTNIIYETFIANKTFLYFIMDRDGIVLFTGIVNNI